MRVAAAPFIASQAIIAPSRSDYGITPSSGVFSGLFSPHP
jgi:hypothetical protein